MRIPVHHHDNGQPHAYLSGCYHHDEEYEQLPVDPRIRVRNGQRMMMHLGEGYQQQIHRIQHQLDAHENNDRVAPGEHAGYPDTKQRY